MRSIFQGGVKMNITNKYDMVQSLMQKMASHRQSGISSNAVKVKPPTMNLTAAELQGVRYGDFSLRFTPSNLTFSPPNWDKIATKRNQDHPDEYYFDRARELARKVFASGEHNEEESQALSRGFISSVSPDRKAIYEETMAKTGGKMPASSMFWDHEGNRTLSYEYDYGTYTALNTSNEFSRARELSSVYLDEMSKLYERYGAKSVGHISLDKIHSDLLSEGQKSAQSDKGAAVDISI